MTLTCCPFPRPNMASQSSGWQTLLPRESWGCLTNGCLTQQTCPSLGQENENQERLILLRDEALSRLGEGPQKHTGCKWRRDTLSMSRTFVGEASVDSKGMYGLLKSVLRVWHHPGYLCSATNMPGVPILLLAHAPESIRTLLKHLKLQQPQHSRSPPSLGYPWPKASEPSSA